MLDTFEQKMIDSYYLHELEGHISYLENALIKNWDDDKFDELTYATERFERGGVAKVDGSLSKSEIAEIHQSVVEYNRNETITNQIITEIGLV